VKERRASGRLGGFEALDQQQERALKRRALLENELAPEEEAELSQLARGAPGLEGYASWLGARGKVGPCKVTRVELETMLAERQQAPAPPVMSPRSALAYAAWIVAAERGWHPSKLETNGEANRASLEEGHGSLGPLFGHLSQERPGSGQELPTDLARRYAPYLGEDGARATSQARLHTDDEAAELAAARGAHAVTFGRDIYFGRGELAPGTRAGDELLVHELTHVAQGQRGEIYHAAAKLTSGISLEAGEAEAELRGKMAGIELHEPAARPPQVAAPSGQPASPGERAARLAAQKARLAEADRDTIPDTESKPPAQAAAEAAVVHPTPEMTAPPKPSGKPNAYVEALEELPSKQALGAWSGSGGKATAETRADQAAFEAALPPMPIELSGDDGKPVAKAETGGAQVSAKEPAPGVVPAAARPTTPTPPAPQVTAAAASVENLGNTQDPEALKAAGKKALDELPTTSPAVKSDPGTPPVTDLAGQADPVRATADQQSAYADGAKGLEAEKKKILSGPGAAQLQPAKLSEQLDVPKAAPVEAMPELPKIEGMEKFKRWNLPGDVQGSFDNLAKPKMEANLAQARAKITAAEVKRDGDRDQAVTDAQSKVKQAHVDADAKQQAKVAESRTKITNKQSETLGKQEAEVKKLDQQSGAKKKATLGKINTRIAADQAKVETDYTDAQKRADAERQKGEAEAQRQKEEAKKKEEDKSWWDRAVDAVCDAIKAVADAIDKALEAVGKLIGEILDAVKNAACALIDAARDFVCAALSEFGDWLKSAVTALLGSVFPELAAALNKFIDDAVKAAQDAVNAIADGLKAAVTALCDTLKATINAAIAAYRAAVQAAATFAQAVVTGDWKAVAKMVLEGILSLLGIDPAAFYALIGKAEDSIAKIIDDPGAFVGHLVDAVKLGFQQFGANFLTHLKDGVVQWLFGTFAEAGINIPATFDIAGVFDLTCQVLGLTWPRMRTKVVKVIGEENTERLEFVAKYVEALVSGGFGGLWQQVQQDMAGLWDMVIGGARQWLMEKLVQQAIIKVATMWNPAGAIIQLIQTAWNVYCWVKENAQRIFGLVQAVVDSISNIANGNIASAANYIESSLAKLVPIAISLFANLLGLGGIADKIKDIITKVQTKIDQAIDKLIDRVAKMWKGGGKGKSDGKADAKGGKTDGKNEQADAKKPDQDRPIGKRITFRVGPETHTQYIDKGVPMVASTPTGVKAKVEKEWRPRLQQLEEQQKKQAGSLIGKAIAIEKQVAKLAGEAKTDKGKDAPLERKQQELADTLAVLWEIMAPDLDPSKAFAEQDPKATIKSDQYKQFKQRFLKLASDLQMHGGDAKAQEIWLKVVEALQKTDAAYKAAPTDAKSGRKDLAADGFKKIMAEFDPITDALKPYMEKWTKGKKSWAFWSGKPSVELAKKHAEVCLEKSALGGLFDNINISGGWDIQMWASLSKAYASHAATNIGGAHFSGFVGMGSSADQSIFNKIEQPTFVGMLSEKQKVTLKIDWYAAAGDPEKEMKTPDYRFKAGAVDGVYAEGERPAMVEQAERENKRRLELWKDKGINEGPGGAAGDKASDAPVIATGDMKGEDHKLTVDLKKGEIRLASIEAGALLKVDDALTKVKGMAAPAARKKDAEKALTAIRGLIKSLHGMLENYLNSKNKAPKPASIDAMKEKADGVMAALKKYGTDFGVHDVVDLPVFDSTEDYQKLAEQVGGERLDKGIAFWESNVKESQFKEGTVEIWAGWKVKDVAAVKAPAIDILAKAAMDDKQPNGKADGAGKMDKLIAGTSSTKVPFFTAAGELATKQAIAEGKAKATKPETKQAIDKTSYVPGGDYGKLETPKNGDHADPRLKRAVQVAGGIVAFMKGMATVKQAGGMSHADFEAAWADQQNVDYLKDEFRDADPGKHEWIPSNKIKDIITRAHSARDLEQAAAWVELHHTLRCDTEHLIYKPSYAPNTTNIGGVNYTLLCGHSGALHLRNPNGPKPSPSIGMQQTWHTELRDIFEANKTILACIDALRAKLRDTIWDGVTALPADVYTDYVDAAGNPIDWSTRSKDQAARFATVDACFEKCRVALAKYD
jgi:Domain of unknown function (DUF4157)